MTPSERTNLRAPNEEQIRQSRAILGTIGGPNVHWGSVDVLNVWLAEQRLEAERLASRRLLVATWILAAATVGLVFATIGLIVVGV